MIAKMIKNKTHSERLFHLRKVLTKIDLDGFLVPLTDKYQSEFPPENARRLYWLTGFSGSAGLAVVLLDYAGIFVDGRYVLQVSKEVDISLFKPYHVSEQPIASWLKKYASKKQIGYDPWLHTVDYLDQLEGRLVNSGVSLVAVEKNPIDQIWKDRPQPPSKPAYIYDNKMAGKTSAQKRIEISEILVQQNADSAVITNPESIAWMLNFRGNDLLHTPISLSFAIINANRSVQLFISPNKVSNMLISHFGPDLLISPPNSFASALTELGSRGATVLVSSSNSPSRVVQLLNDSGASVLFRPDPCELLKACKNSAEIAGIRAAHIRDGVAVSRFLCWLSESAPNGEVDELSAAEKILEYRSENKNFVGPSFNTISGAGPNGAIVHYRVTEETNCKLKKGTLYLIDSGGQYLDGTTDITRTVAIGLPSKLMKNHFTRVLKGHIAIATSCFPEGTTGGALDSFARRSLWEIGADFDHGTGHGVGCFLGVHEGPQRIAKRGADTPLCAGMLISNEPGFYYEGNYGIRIENIELVQTQPMHDIQDRVMLAFEALTLAPIDKTLLDIELLNRDEINWWNSYHQRVWETLGPLLDKKTKNWLRLACDPLKLQVE